MLTNKKYIVLLLSLLLKVCNGFSLSQTMSAGSVILAPTICFPTCPAIWSNPGNATVSDNSYATVSFVGSDSPSAILYASSFGFTIPAGATINGISVSIERSASGSVIDNSIQLNNGTGQRALPFSWPTIADMSINYGNATDLWSATWSPASANNLGVYIAVSGPAGATAKIDYISATVYYTISAPLNWISFESFSENVNTIRLDWITASEINTDHFEIENSCDGINFNKETQLNIHATSSESLNRYSCSVNNLCPENFFRIRQIDKDGLYTYSPIIKNYPFTAQEIIELFPNPVTNWIAWKGEDPWKIEISSLDGTKQEQFLNPQASILLNGYSAGLYFVKIYTKDQQMYCKKIVLY